MSCRLQLNVCHISQWWHNLVKIRCPQPQYEEAPSGERLRGKGRHWKCRFSRWRISAILDFRGLIIGSLNKNLRKNLRQCWFSKKYKKFLRKSLKSVEFQYGGRLGEFNDMSSQSHVSHCRVLPLGEFTVTADGWQLKTVHYRSANQANSAFHPIGLINE